MKVNGELGWPKIDADVGILIDNVLRSLKYCGNDAFGGAYFDRENPAVLHVNLLKGKERILGFSDPSIVKTHFVRYSIEELDKVQTQINDIVGKYSIEFVARDEEANRLEIGVVDRSGENLEKIRSVIASMGIDVAELVYFSSASDHRDCEWGKAEVAKSIANADSGNKNAADSEALSTLSVRVGCWVGTKSSATGSALSARSISFGAYYNGSPYFVTAGHTWGSIDSGTSLYYADPPSNTTAYSSTPSNYSTILAAGDGSNSTKIGTFFAAVCSGKVDFCSIARTNGNISNYAYNNYTARYIGGLPAVNQIVRYTGISNRNIMGSGSASYGTCSSNNVSYVSVDGTTITNGIRMSTNSDAYPGSSGGPLMYLINSSDTNTVCITGMASKPDNANNCVYFTRVSELISQYNLVPAGLTLV